MGHLSQPTSATLLLYKQVQVLVYKLPACLTARLLGTDHISSGSDLHAALMAQSRPCMQQDPERQKEVGELLGDVDSDEYSHLVTLGKMMSDYSAAGAAVDGEAVNADMLDDDIGVAVEFENEDEDDEEDEVDEIMVRYMRLPSSSCVHLIW